MGVGRAKSIAHEGAAGTAALPRRRRRSQCGGGGAFLKWAGGCTPAWGGGGGGGVTLLVHTPHAHKPTATHRTVSSPLNLCLVRACSAEDTPYPIEGTQLHAVGWGSTGALPATCLAPVRRALRAAGARHKLPQPVTFVLLLLLLVRLFCSRNQTRLCATAQPGEFGTLYLQIPATPSPPTRCKTWSCLPSAWSAAGCSGGTPARRPP